MIDSGFNRDPGTIKIYLKTQTYSLFNCDQIIKRSMNESFLKYD